MLRKKYVCGAIVIAIGIGVVLTMYLPPQWLAACLGAVLIWTGYRLLCR